MRRIPLLPARCQRRCIFTLPSLSSFSPFSSPGSNQDKHTYHERKILPYNQFQLYKIVADVGSYPRFIPFCTDARILRSSSPTPERGASPATIMDAELTVGFLSFKESYVSKVTCRPYDSVEATASSSSPLFKTLVTTWQFQPASSKSGHPTTSDLPHQDVRAEKLRSLESTGQPHARTDDGPTLVTLDLAYAFANPIHATVSAAFFGQVSKLMVNAFEKRCLEVYGPGNP